MRRPFAKSTLLGALLVLFSFRVSSQWSVNVVEHYKKEAELTVGLNNRNTHIFGEFGTIYGLKFGLNFNRKLKNTFIASSTIKQLGDEGKGNAPFETAQLHFLSVAEELTFYKKKPFAAITYLSLGYGFNIRRLYGISGQLVDKSRTGIAPLELGLIGSYEVLKWLDLRAGFGWRLLLLGGSRELNGYFIKLGLGFRFKSFRRAIDL